LQGSCHWNINPNRSGVKEKNSIGMYVTNMPFRVNLSANPHFEQFTKDLSRDFRQLLRYQRYPFLEILRDYRESCNSSENLYDIALSYQNMKYQIENFEYYSQVLKSETEINSLNIHISDRAETDNLCFDYDYRLEYFDDQSIELIHKHFLCVLRQAISNPNTQLSQLSLLSEEEENRVLYEFNKTPKSFPGPKTLHELFEEQVLKSPQKTAVICGKEKLTYLELNQISNQLAKSLQAKGVGRDHVIGLMATRSVKMLSGFLGILKAGAAYLPIDPEYPPERINYMLKHSCAQILVTDKALMDKHIISDETIDCLFLDDLNLNSTEICNSDSISTASDLANIIFTSGSTGTPKAVMIEHGSLVNLIHAFSEFINFHPTKTVLSVTTISFDMFFVESLLPLAKGLKVILATREEQSNPDLIIELIDKHKVNFFQTTPSRMQAILKALNHSSHPSLSTLTDIILGGEVLPEPLVKQLKMVSNAHLFNGYGPTEISVCATAWKVETSDIIPIGKPILNTLVYILDQNLRPVPVGVPGEIYIGGYGVARGYLGAEDLTNDRFIPNPFAEGRIYKTGDLGLWLPNGAIEYLGRNDHQVKIRGYRIELGEVEKSLEKHPLVEQAVVISSEDTQVKKYLLAYYTGSRLSPNELRAFLVNILPDYMIPAEFIWLEKFPLNSNGKIDRHSLPSVKLEKQDYVPPRTEIEQFLCEAWAKALNMEKVGIDDNLFMLGGDSLTIVEILSSLLSYHWNIKAQDFYTYPNIRELAQVVFANENKPQALTKDLIRVPANFHGIKNNGEHPKAILITGATGFLGIHLLDKIISQKTSKVYCLVRGTDARKRLEELLEFYFPGKHISCIGSEVVVINGDVSKSQFGLMDVEYNNLASKIDTVVHASAIVKHYGDYHNFEQVNVKGTEEVIAFCVKFNKSLYHISTLSVAGKYRNGQTLETQFTEKDLYIGQDFDDNIYVRSKLEAEKKVIQALQFGLNACILRVGSLTGRYTDGQFQKNIGENAFYNRLKAIIEVKKIPASWLSQELEFTPVDSCAEAILKLIQYEGHLNPIYHLHNNQTLNVSVLIDFLEEFGIFMQKVNSEEFLTALIQSHDSSSILKGFISDLSIFSNEDSELEIQVSSQLTLQFFNSIHFMWPKINRDYLAKVITYAMKVGFLNLFLGESKFS
jgi:amino acid adenylation domain-containing protein/thioester reductase-like protein